MFLSAIEEARLVGEPCRIVVDCVSLFTKAVSYYKNPIVDTTCSVYIDVTDSPAVDAGGSKRHFFADVLKSLKQDLALFEGSNNHLLLICSPSTSASGLFKVLGRVVSTQFSKEGLCFLFLLLLCLSISVLL